MGFARWMLPLLIALMVTILTSCATSARVFSAEVSQDDLRLLLVVGSCNASSIETTVTDVGHRVELAVTAFPARLLGGGDCQDIAIVALPAPLAGRDVIDRSTREVIPVSPSGRPWPYDRDRFSPADYEAALAEMVVCLESRDPQIGAAIVDDLDWPTYEWHKERDERGNMSAPAVGECSREHLEPLRG